MQFPSTENVFINFLFPSDMKTRADTKEISRIYFWVSSNISVIIERLRGVVSKEYLFEGICEFEAKIEKRRELYRQNFNNKKISCPNQWFLANNSCPWKLSCEENGHIFNEFERSFDLRSKFIPKHYLFRRETTYTWSNWEKRQMEFMSN